VKAVDLAGILGVGKSLVSDVLNYRRGLSKEIIRKLASQFKLSQEAFNKPYELVMPSHHPSKNGNAANSRKKLSRGVQLK
jgi:HTH-type transcriptional regulator/antitoxin HigA